MAPTTRPNGPIGAEAPLAHLEERSGIPALERLLGLQRTKLSLLRLLLDHDTSVDELASSTGVDRTVARRHLADLRSAGFVTNHPIRGTRGRPKNAYVITTAGREVFFARYDVMLDLLTRSSLRRSGTRGTRALFAEAGKTFASDLGFPSTSGSVVEALRAVGFEPELRTARGRRLVISRNCPVLRQARRTPDLVCEAFHSSLLSRAFEGTEATLLHTMARGAPECVHVLSERESRAVADR